MREDRGIVLQHLMLRCAGAEAAQDAHNIDGSLEGNDFDDLPGIELDLTEAEELLLSTLSPQLAAAAPHPQPLAAAAPHPQPQPQTPTSGHFSDLTVGSDVPLACMGDHANHKLVVDGAVKVIGRVSAQSFVHPSGELHSRVCTSRWI